MKALTTISMVLLLFSLSASSLFAIPPFKIVRATVRENPNDLRSRVLLGKYYFKAGQYKNALEQMKFVVSKRPRLWSFHNRIALLHYKIGRAERNLPARKTHWKKALKEWRHVLRNQAKNRRAKYAYSF